MNYVFKIASCKIHLVCAFIALIVLGFLFLINAMEAARIFPAFYDIDNVLAKYIVVIITMACGIMLFSNLATLIEADKLRNGLTIFITTFSTVLTVPLVYVFIAIFPMAARSAMGPVGKVMSLDKILAGFIAWFGNGALLYVVLVVMLLLSIVFISFPLLTGILAVKGKTIKVGAVKRKIRHRHRAPARPSRPRRRRQTTTRRGKFGQCPRGRGRGVSLIKTRVDLPRLPHCNNAFIATNRHLYNKNIYIKFVF